ALALEGRGLEVRAANRHEQPVQLPEVLVLQAEVGGLDGRRAVLAEDPVRRVAVRGHGLRPQAVGTHQTARGPAVERPGTQYLRRRLTRSMRSCATRSAASAVEIRSSRATRNTSRRVR